LAAAALHIIEGRSSSGGLARPAAAIDKFVIAGPGTEGAGCWSEPATANYWKIAVAVLAALLLAVTVTAVVLLALK
jgi:hypothetical protein